MVFNFSFLSFFITVPRSQTNFALQFQLLQLLRLAIGLELPQMQPLAPLFLVHGWQSRFDEILLVVLVVLLVLVLFIVASVALVVGASDLHVIRRARQTMVLQGAAVFSMAILLNVGHSTASGYRATLLHRIRPR